MKATDHHNETSIEEVMQLAEFQRYQRVYHSIKKQQLVWYLMIGVSLNGSALNGIFFLQEGKALFLFASGIYAVLTLCVLRLYIIWKKRKKRQKFTQTELLKQWEDAQEMYLKRHQDALKEVRTIGELIPPQYGSLEKIIAFLQARIEQIELKKQAILHLQELYKKL